MSNLRQRESDQFGWESRRADSHDDELSVINHVRHRNTGDHGRQQHWMDAPVFLSRTRRHYRIEAKLGEAGKPKKRLPGFELVDISGKPWKLAQLAGKVVLINLWATWCGPCRAELPQFQKLYERTKERNRSSGDLVQR